METSIAGSPPTKGEAGIRSERTRPQIEKAAPEFSANDGRNVKPGIAIGSAGLALHPLSELFPRMNGADFEALKADIRANGLHQPIVFHEGQILDGGNRYRACVELGITPAAVEYAGTDPLGFVFSANARRRHLTPGQYAAIVASAQNWELAQAHGGDRKSDQAATLPLASVADRAAHSGASERTQKMADKVARANPALSRQVAHGEISLPQAVRQVEKKPQPVAAPAPAIEPEPVDDPHADLLADLEREVAENRALQERIDALTKDDIAAELDKRIKLYHQLDGRLQQEITTRNEAQREATRKGKVLAAIRKFLGVERDSEILPKLKGGA